MEGSVVAYCGERLEEHTRGAGRLTEVEEALLDLLNRKLRRRAREGRLRRDPQEAQRP
jgi:hypothetical protein